MNKTIAAVVVLVVLGAAAYFFFTSREVANAPQENPEAVATPDEEAEEEEDSGEERTVRGTVVSVNSEQVPVDGPTLVTIEIENGEEAIIAIPSMGINLCAAQEHIADLAALAEGDTVEVRGQVGVDSMIIPCDSAEHYLRVVEA